MATSQRRVGPRLAIEGARRAGQASWQAAVRFFSGHDLTYASSIAYYSLLSLFPFLLLLFSLMGWAVVDEAARRSVFDFVALAFPTQFEFVTAQLDVMRTQHVSLGVAGSLLMIWGALGVFGAITSAVNYAWNVERHPNYLMHQVVSFVMLATAGLLFGAALVAMSARPVLEASWGPWLAGRFPWIESLALLSGVWGRTLAVTAVAALLFYFVPNTEVRFGDVWPGAAVTAVLWQLALWTFTWYVGQPARMSVHGSIASVVGFLLWVYVSAAVLLYGVEFTAAYARLRASGLAPPARTRA